MIQNCNTLSQYRPLLLQIAATFNHTTNAKVGPTSDRGAPLPPDFYANRFARLFLKRLLIFFLGKLNSPRPYKQIRDDDQVFENFLWPNLRKRCSIEVEKHGIFQFKSKAVLGWANLIRIGRWFVLKNVCKCDDLVLFLAVCWKFGQLSLSVVLIDVLKLQ